MEEYSESFLKLLFKNGFHYLDGIECSTCMWESMQIDKIGNSFGKAHWVKFVWWFLLALNKLDKPDIDVICLTDSYLVKNIV